MRLYFAVEVVGKCEREIQFNCVFLQQIFHLRLTAKVLKTWWCIFEIFLLL